MVGQTDGKTEDQAAVVPQPEVVVEPEEDRQCGVEQDPLCDQAHPLRSASIRMWNVRTAPPQSCQRQDKKNSVDPA